MQILKLTRTGPEQIVMPVTNVDARSLTQGWPVALRLGTNASMNFNNAVLALSGTAADLPGFLGVADQDIATNAVGRVILWGYAKSVYISQTGTSITINNADPLVPGAAGFFSLAPTYAASGFKYVIASAVPTTGVTSTLSNAVNVLFYSGFVKGGL
mgnify:CR=1 FL=1